MEGTRISHYEFVRRLGRGGMGEVWEAVDLDLHRRVALKFIAPEFAADAETVRRFEREARAAAALAHPNIATVYSFDRSTDRPFIAMELIGGERLRDRLERGPLPVAEALRVARDAAAALALAHRRGVVHRDVKPENLMFDAEGAVKVMDFGLARSAQLSRLTMTGSTLGTAAYMAPEATRGAVDAPADVFALGVVLHEMLAGSLPFAGDSPLALLYTIANEPPRPLREARPEAPAEVEALLARMLEKDPAARIDAESVARALGAPATRPATEELEAVRVPHPTAGADPAAALEPLRAKRRGLSRGMAAVLMVAVGTIMVLVPMLRRKPAQATGQQAIAMNNAAFDSLARGKLDDARLGFEAALRLDPDYGEPLVNLGTLHLRQGDATQAAAYYGQALERHPGDHDLAARAHYGLGEVDMRSESWASAVGHLEQSLALDSTSNAVYNNLGYALLRAGRTPEAAAVLQRGVARFPGVAELHKNLGLAELARGDAAAATAEAARAIELEPALASAWALRARALARAGDLPGARAALSRLTELETDPIALAEAQVAVTQAEVQKERDSIERGRTRRMPPEREPGRR